MGKIYPNFLLLVVGFFGGYAIVNSYYGFQVNQVFGWMWLGMAFLSVILALFISILYRTGIK